MATYGYARVSTAAQADRGDGLAVQRQKIHGRAAMDA
jgi:DNA invertase Pin-like site-specific DNA recombinase